MSKKSAIVYTSHTGNTEKVAHVFKRVFENKGWQCDMFKVEKTTKVDELPDYDDYDFICLGAPIVYGLPAREVFFGRPNGPGWRKRGGLASGKLEIGYGPNKSVAFVTYSGELRGPGEATMALDLLELRLEDANVKCVGRFACPGSWKDLRIDGTPWHYDLDNRPNERDLKKAEIFMEEVLEDYYYEGEREAAPISQYVCIA